VAVLDEVEAVVALVVVVMPVRRVVSSVGVGPGANVIKLFTAVIYEFS
jgi:hypothetical protein